MIFHAWDSPSPFIFVVIAADRDLAYALAMLRMKSYRIVLISPAGAHTDLTSQASVHLDWSKTILGLNDGSNEGDLFQKESPDRMAASVDAPPESARPEQGTFTFRSDPLPPVTLRNSPGLPHKPPVFSGSYNHGLNIFGGPRFGSPISSHGLGSGPLFPRPLSESQKPVRSRSGSLPDFSWPTFFPNKGKKKSSEPEDLEPHPPPPPSGSKLRSSTYIFEPFDDDDDGELPGPQPSPPRTTVVPEPAVSRDSSQSRQSKFSFEQISEPSEVDATEPAQQPPNSSPPKNAPAPLSSEPAAVTVPQAETNPKQPTIPPLPPVVPSATSSPKAAKPKAAKPKAAKPAAKPLIATPKRTSNVPLPPAWVPLIQTLRRHNGVIPRSTIAETLLKYYPEALNTAGAKNIKKYLNAAISSGIVLKSARADGTPEIHLRMPFWQ